MRKVIVVLVAIILVALTACGKKDNYTITTEENLQMYISEVKTLNFTVKNNEEVVEKEVDIIVADPTTVSLEGKNLTALKEGSTVVTLKLKDDPKVAVNINVNIGKSLTVTAPTNIVYVGQEITLTFLDKADTENKGITWISGSASTATVVNGVVKGKKPGLVSITARSNTNECEVTIELEVRETTIEGVEINAVNSLYAQEEIKLTHAVTPSYAVQDVTWSSSDELIATVDEDGNVRALRPGEVTITATSKVDTTKKATVTFTVSVDPIKIFESFNVENPIVQYVTTYGYNPDERYQWVYGSVSKYFNSDMNLKEQIIAITPNKYQGTVADEATILDAENQKAVRSGILHKETNLIVYHDTGNHTPGANATMHANYLVGSDNANNRARSWHYTVDENQIIHHIPDNEVTWQGDNFEAYAYGIGIETCVDFGSDLYTTWQRTAKLMASLLVKYGLTTDNIKQHHDFLVTNPDGTTWYKDCPRTLRHANLYDNAISLVEAEYYVLTLLDGYDISFKSLNPTYVDDRGRIIQLPATATRVGYVVNIKKGSYDESVVLYSVIPGEDGTTEVNLTGTQADFNAAREVDLVIANLPVNVTKEDSAVISQARAAYDSLTQVQKDLVTTLEVLINRELLLHKLDAVNTSVVINQVLISDNGVTKFGYIELYNTTNAAISLKNWTIQYAKDNDAFSIEEAKLGQTWYKFKDDDVIKAKGYFLIQVEEGNSVGNHYLPLPNAITNIYLDGNGKLALTNAATVVSAIDNTHIIDFVGYGNVNLFEGANAYKGSLTNLAMVRREFVDTNNNENDFVSITPNPTNAANEKINFNATESQKKAMAVDIMILSLPEKVKLSDETIITEARTAYNALTEDEKALVKRLTILENKEKEFMALKNPDLVPIYEVLNAIPAQIVDDFTFPVVSGVTIAYKDGQDTSCFNLQTGKILKTTYAYKPVVLQATYDDTTVEFTVNFGLLKEGQKTIFTTGENYPAAGGQAKDGKGTYNEQLNLTGFGGVAITFENNVYFVGFKAFIVLNKPATGNTLTRSDLRPYGSSSDTSIIYNQGLVKGVPTGYKGSGVLYYNASDVDLTFDPSDTYGRNNANMYGHGKVVFSPNEDGSYSVKKPWAESGSNNTTNGTKETLKPGEYLYCPHTFDTNLKGGTWLTFCDYNGTTGDGVLYEGGTIYITKYKQIG